jgi:hypothetical protein
VQQQCDVGTVLGLAPRVGAYVPAAQISACMFRVYFWSLHSVCVASCFEVIWSWGLCTSLVIVIYQMYGGQSMCRTPVYAVCFIIFTGVCWRLSCFRVPHHCMLLHVINSVLYCIYFARCCLDVGRGALAQKPAGQDGGGG